MAEIIPTANFGDTDVQVTRVGLGGEGVLRTFGEEERAGEMLDAALGQGIGYFDTARAYAGSEKYLGAFWRANPGARERVFHTSKSAQRSREGALRELDTTLENLGTDWLDLWQIHDVRTEADIEEIEARDGALDAFLEAREADRVRHIGVTGHHDPAILTRCVRVWPIDAVLLPVNPVEGVLGGFLTETLPAARDKGLAVIGMKVFGAGYYLNQQGGLTAELLLRYALSHDVTLVIVGCSKPGHVRTLAQAAREFEPMTVPELRRLETAFEPHARRLAYYRGQSEAA